MKLFKLISICVISIILIISIVLNIFLLSGVKFVTDAPEEPISHTIVDNKNIITTEPVPKPSYPDHTVKEEIVPGKTDVPITYLYEDNNIRVKYLGQDKKRVECTYLFEVENISSKTVNVLFTDIYLDGQQLFISGLTCENLLPKTTVVEDFVLSSKEVDQSYKFPVTVTFKIKLVNSKSYLDLYESKQITLTF